MVNTPPEIVTLANRAAIAKGKLSTPKIITAGFLAGVYISIGALLSIIAGYGFPEISAGNPSMARLLMGATFPIGLTLIVLAGAELFTGNCAVLIPNLLSGRQSFGSVARNWGLVWLSNFVGALLFGYFMVYLTEISSSEVMQRGLFTIAQAKTGNPFYLTFLKGIGANWLVCLAVWLGMSSRDVVGKILGLWLPVMAFVIVGYEHSIANMFFLPLGMMEGSGITSAELWGNLIPATLGNIVGGALFVGTAYWYLYDNKSRELE